MNQMLLGAIAMASLTISLFFLRFWRVTGDRFFLFFAASFFIEGLDRIILGVASYTAETEPYIYFVRFFSFLLIVIAIVDKNRKTSKPPTTHHDDQQS
jgi:hypothetical protein